MGGLNLVFSSLGNNIILSAILFVVGLVVGSFLNVVILRGNKGQPIGGRSHCLSCGKKLNPLELIPIFSFLIQQGRCTGCDSWLSWQYPIVEFATALLFSATTWYITPGLIPSFSGWLNWLAILTSIAAAIVIFVSDLRFQLIPNGAVILLGLGALFIWIIKRGGAWQDLIASAVFALFFAALWFGSQGKWMGLGDAKLVFVTSLWVGFPNSLGALLFSFWLGGLTGLFLLLTGKKKLSSRIPFGPFIIMGSVIAYFFSDSFLIATGLR